METITVTGQDAIELIGRAKKGDRSAFDQLFSSAQDQLVNLVRSRLGPSLGRQIDPEDVLQVIIAADADDAGKIAAREAAQRFIAEGRHVKVCLPPDDAGDFNDVLMASAGSETGA